jgi:RNA polymerase sigma factor (sigma-70 family)
LKLQGPDASLGQTILRHDGLQRRCTVQSRFATTSWNKVLAARDASSPDARQALEGLCRTYWYPLYAFVRRQGNDAEESRDLTQAYFAELLEKGYLDAYDPEKGRFRVFLMVSARHFLSKQREKALAWKRGGRANVVSLDAEDVEGRYRHEPADRLTPEQVFERRWAVTVLERALARLRLEQEDVERSREFARLEGFLTGERPTTSYREAAKALGTTESAVKSTLFRLRKRYGQLLRSEIAETVSSAAEVDDELRHLLSVVNP